MFRAAEVVGPQTRPLLVFYGLSQAGRAIAAAAIGLKGEDWNLVAHGIHATGYHKDFADIEIRTDPAGSAGSFVRLSELLQSPVWGNNTVVRLEDVWDILPSNLQYPLTLRERLTPLYASSQIGDQSHPLLTIDVGDIPDRVVDGGSREVLEAFLAAYPGTAGHHSFVIRTVAGEDIPNYRRHQPDAGWLYVNWEMPPECGAAEQRLARLHTMTRIRRPPLLLSCPRRFVTRSSPADGVVGGAVRAVDAGPLPARPVGEPHQRRRQPARCTDREGAGAGHGTSAVPDRRHDRGSRHLVVVAVAGHP
jgi:hypothetical protein